MFRITEVCDKVCPTCCCGNGTAVVSPEAFRAKLLDIRQCVPDSEGIFVYLTGGEPFLYRGRDQESRGYTIIDIVQMVDSILAGSRIIIKTSGWTPHSVLDRLLKQSYAACQHTCLEARLGFNLYQNSGASAESRLRHMIDLIMWRQDVMKIEMIYDRQNLIPSLLIVGDVLSRYCCLQPEDLLEAVVHPEMAYRFEIPIEGSWGMELSSAFVKRTIVLETMPAHAGFAGRISAMFIHTPSGGICHIIEDGPNGILYNPDLSFQHCNDAFADHSLPPFRSEQSASSASELDFLTQQFTQLKAHLKETGTVFAGKREQCLYCSNFIHSSTAMVDFTTGHFLAEQ